MRRSLLALTIAATALALGACTSSSAPGWTYAPPTVAPSAAASADGSAAPSGAAPSDAAPSAGASAAPSDGAGAGDSVSISAVGIAFEQTEVSAPADTAFVISFENKEAVPHNVEIKDGGGASVFKGDIVTGPTVVEYQAPALTAGGYQFVCSVHPNMVGTLTVGG